MQITCFICTLTLFLGSATEIIAGNRPTELIIATLLMCCATIATTKDI